MPTFRADIRVDADPVLGDLESVAFKCSGYTVSVRNATPEREHVTQLDFTVVGGADSFEVVADQFREFLATYLDHLAFTTSGTYKVAKVWRVIDWEPQQRTRRYKCIESFNLGPPLATLASAALDSAAATVEANLPGYLDHSLHCFRNARLSMRWDDRFMQLWTAFESLANGAKEATKINVPCPVCQGPLACKNCAIEPTRRRMAIEAMRELLGALAQGDTSSLWKGVTAIRHGIAHGRSRPSIEADAGLPISHCLEEMGRLACFALRKEILAGNYKVPIFVQDCEVGFAAFGLTRGVIGEFDQTDAEADFPPEDALPNINQEEYLCHPETGARVNNVQFQQAMLGLGSKSVAG